MSWPCDILIGDVRDRLRELPSDHFDCVVTSPPYWGLRDYGVVGQIGLEPTLGEHLAVMVEVFEEVKRVLKPTGTLWVNYGDCYATSPNGRSAADTKAAGGDDRTFRDKPFSTVGGVLRGKDLAMVPNRLAIELQKPRYQGRIVAVEDRVWLACLIDGEGSIFGTTQPAGYPTGRGRKYVRTQAHFDTGITISNTCRALLDRCVEITGYGSVKEAKRGKTNRRAAYVWRIQGSKAKEVLSEIYPHLVAKQHEARLAIGSPPSGDLAQRCHDGLKALHQGLEPGVDLPAPPTLYRPGWWVRSEIIWAKPNPMPESVKDRPSTSHEKIFMLSKAPRYHYDAAAVRQGRVSTGEYKTPDGWDTGVGGHGSRHRTGRQKGESVAEKRAKVRAVDLAAPRHAGHINHTGIEETPRGEGRSLRNYEPAPAQVWNVATRPFSEAHFATFPPELAERCLLAGCPKAGHVLDPFGGAGTVGLVAWRLGLKSTLIELNPEYAEIARARLHRDQGILGEITITGDAA